MLCMEAQLLPSATYMGMKHTHICIHTSTHSVVARLILHLIFLQLLMKVECGRCEWTCPTSTHSSHPPSVSHTTGWALIRITISRTMNLRAVLLLNSLIPGIFLMERGIVFGCEAIHCTLRAYILHLKSLEHCFLTCRLHEQNLPPKYR